MKSRTRKIIIAAIVTVGAFGFTASAAALWAANNAAQVPAIMVGDVSFGASGQTDATAEYSTDGGPVTVTLPGSEIDKVLDQTALDAPPVIWRFTATGYARGITGLNFDVSMGSQVAQDGAVTDLPRAWRSRRPSWRSRPSRCTRRR